MPPERPLNPGFHGGFPLQSIRKNLSKCEAMADMEFVIKPAPEKGRLEQQGLSVEVVVVMKNDLTMSPRTEKWSIEKPVRVGPSVTEQYREAV